MRSFRTQSAGLPSTNPMEAAGIEPASEVARNGQK
jgi:hypothetical protein